MNNDYNNFNQSNNSGFNPQQSSNMYQQPVSQMGDLVHQPVQPQPQPTPVEPPVQNNYNMNTQPTNTPKKKSNIGLIIGIVVAVAVVIGVVVMLIVGGGEKKNESNNNTPSDVTPNNEKTNNNTKLSYTRKVPGKSIYVDVPSWDPMELNYKMTTTVYKIQGTKYVSVTCLKDTANSVDEAYEMTFDAFKQNMYRYHPINSVSFTSKTNEKINGIDVYKFEGTMNCREPDNVNSNYDAYTIGYSFIFNDTPCSIIGSVQETSQQKSNISEVKSTIEEMMKTVRTER